jgi:hypothetical protein
MAIRLRPDRAAMYRYYLAHAFAVMGDHETVVDLLSTSDNKLEGHRILAVSYMFLGRPALAAYHREQTLKRHPGFSLAQWRTVLPHRDADLRAQIIELMEQAGLP